MGKCWYVRNHGSATLSPPLNLELPIAFHRSSLRWPAPKVLHMRYSSRPLTLVSEGNPEAKLFPDGLKLTLGTYNWPDQGQYPPTWLTYVGCNPEAEPGRHLSGRRGSIRDLGPGVLAFWTFGADLRTPRLSSLNIPPYGEAWYDGATPEQYLPCHLCRLKEEYTSIDGVDRPPGVLRRRSCCSTTVKGVGMLPSGGK